MNQQLNLEAAQAAFLQSGGQIIVLEGFEYVPHRAHRDLEEVKAPREKAAPSKISLRLQRIAQLRKLSETMTYAQASEATGFSRSVLDKAAQEGGFAFKRESMKGRPGSGNGKIDPVADKKLAERIIAIRDIGVNRAQAQLHLKISDKKFNRVLRDHGIDYPKARPSYNHGKGRI